MTKNEDMLFLLVAVMYAAVSVTTCRFIVRRFFPDENRRNGSAVLSAAFCSVLWPLFWPCYAVVRLFGGSK